MIENRTIMDSYGFDLVHDPQVSVVDISDRMNEETTTVDDDNDCKIVR